MSFSMIFEVSLKEQTTLGRRLANQHGCNQLCYAIFCICLEKVIHVTSLKSKTQPLLDKKPLKNETSFANFLLLFLMNECLTFKARTQLSHLHKILSIITCMLKCKNYYHKRTLHQTVILTGSLRPQSFTSLTQNSLVMETQIPQERTSR